MSALFYHTGEEVLVGDRVRLAADEGRILHLDDELAAWGLSEEERKGKVMIECRSMALVCEFAASKDLDFLGRAQPKTSS
jgi:hypothetical protein